MILALAAITCNMPSTVREPVLSPEQIADTAVAAALTAQAAAVVGPGPALTPPTPTAASPTPEAIAAQCSPTITANTDANVRSGPGTAYAAVGYIPTGGTAPVAGRNDANTWWYIQFAGGSGGYAWIAGSVVTASCVPPVVQVVAAPALPTDVPPTETQEFALGPFEFIPMVQVFPLLADGDVELQDVFLSAGGEVIARVSVNPGGSLTGNVTYKVWVDGDLKTTKTETLPFGSMAYWSGVVVSGTHDVKVKVDAGNAITETDEGNNEWQGSLSH
jgi:hypothetical protein